MLKVDSKPTHLSFLTKLPVSIYFYNKRKKKQLIFYINNKNLVTKIIKPNPGQSLLL